jgi:hypothetical protein
VRQTGEIVKAKNVLFSMGALVLLVIPLVTARASDSSCANPDSNQLIREERAGVMPVKFYPVANTRGVLRWAFASWEGPPEGTALVVGCDGKPAASFGTGFVEHVRSGPVVNHRGTVEIIVIPDFGTGISDHSVELLQFDGRRILKLWSHMCDDEWGEPVPLGNRKYGEETGKNRMCGAITMMRQRLLFAG